jgi:hypothetical protein
LQELSGAVGDCCQEPHKHSVKNCGKRQALGGRKGNSGARVGPWPCGKSEHTHTAEGCLAWWFPESNTRISRPPQTPTSTLRCALWDTLNQLDVYVDSRFKTDFAVCGCHFTSRSAIPHPTCSTQLVLVGDKLPVRATFVANAASVGETLVQEHGSPAANTRGGAMADENPGEVLAQVAIGSAAELEREQAHRSADLVLVVVGRCSLHHPLPRRCWL